MPPTPVGGEIVTVGTVVYPLPTLVRVMAVTAPAVTVAVASAPVPPPPVMVTTWSRCVSATASSNIDCVNDAGDLIQLQVNETVVASV